MGNLVSLMLSFIYIWLVSAPTILGNPHSLKGGVKPRWASSALGKDSSFDYVIIGGGTAGLAMAARLAESHNNTVAVIEAGGYYEDNPMSNLSVIPADDIYYAGASPSDIDPLVDWGFVTAPQAVCKTWNSPSRVES